MGNNTGQSDNGQLDELRDLVSGVEEVTKKKTDRRGMLRMAGGAVLGAAGMAALKIVPASAASGGNFILGCGNATTSDTTLINTGGNAVGMTVQAGIHGLEGVASGGSNEVGLVGVTKSGTGIGVGGQATNSGGSGIGVKGQAGSGTGVQGLSSTGAGVEGLSSTGASVAGLGTAGQGGLFVSSTGYDAQLGFPVLGGAVGSGRLGMVGRLDVGAVAPNIAPAFQVTSTGTFTFEHELVRGNDSSIWASRFMASGTNQSRWKRINAVRVDTSDGTGATFAPFRVFDTRSGAIKAAGSTTVVPVAGQGAGASNIPAGAVAVIGNLTATQYTGGGFLSIAPAGVTVGTSAVNFITGQAAIANGFIVGLSGGNLQVKVAGHASHFLVDITGYIE